MKRYPFAFLLFWGLVCACTNLANPETVSIRGNEITTIHAEVADAMQTKTILNGGKIYWCPGDAINVFYGDQSNGQFVTTISAPSASANFNGSIEVVEGHAENSTEPNAFWGVYPYDVSNACDGTSVTMTIPSVQEALEDSFANGLNPAVAKSLGLAFSFYNVGSWFCFTVAQSGITSATLKGNGGESLSGKVGVAMGSDDRPVCTVVNGVDHITMNAPEGGFVPGREYRMVLIPQTLESGYSLTLQKGNAYATYSNNNSLQFARNGGRGKLNVDNGLAFSGNISFYDALVKQLCVAKWDTDNDGELSFEEAAAVTALETVFQETAITSFEELRYFIGLTSIDNAAFQGCSQLSSIVIPNSVQSIGDNAFSSCTSLAEITIPANVTSIGANAFSNCPALASVVLEPATPPTLGSNALETGGGVVVHVPESVVDTYLNATGWKTYATSIFSTAVPESVDLGLSVKWATCNVGASSEEETGSFYAWGALVPQKNGSVTDKTYYYQGSEEMPLPASRDIASVAYGGTWRMPSKEEWTELVNNCTWEYTTSGGKKGYLVTSRLNGGSIFLPIDYSVSSSATTGNYWLNDYHSANNAKCCQISDTHKSVFGYIYRYECLMIRPVKE